MGTRTTPATPVVEARAVPPSAEGEGLSSRMAALNANCASHRAELETAEADLTRYRTQVEFYVITDEAELDALLLAIAEDTEAHVPSEKNVRASARACGGHKEQGRASALARGRGSSRRRSDARAAQGEMRQRLDEQERAFARERDELRAENASLRERLDALEAVVAAVVALPQLGPKLQLSVNTDNQGSPQNFVPLLNHAVGSGHGGAVKKLLALGLKPTPCEFKFQDHAGQCGSVSKFSALYHAAWKGGTVAAELLLDNGAQPHIDSNAVVDVAQRGVFQQLFPVLSSNNGPWSQANVAPLQVAANAASLPVVELLVARGAKTHEHQFLVPKGVDGDLVAGFLQTRGSKPVTRRWRTANFGDG